MRRLALWTILVFLLAGCGPEPRETGAQNNQANQGGPSNQTPTNQETGNQEGGESNQGFEPLPQQSCEPVLELVDTSSPDHLVGDGSPESCTEEALRVAVSEGGVIAFDCGDEEVTIDVTAALELRTDVDTVIDGGGLVTLDGGRLQGRTNRLFEYHSPNYRATQTLVVLQRLTLQNGQAPAEDFTDQDPDNPHCAWGYKDGEGGALRMRDGRLHIMESTFRGNRAALTGPDTGGGAIYALGALEVILEGSTFVDNQGSNGGAVGLLQSDGVFSNSVFRDSQATGTGQNFGGATGCPDFNHAEQGGAGGNGGAIAIDGGSVERVEFCGVSITGSSAGGLGTIFRTPNTHRGTTSFHQVHIADNHAESGGGALYMQDMTLSMTASTIAHNTSNGLGAGIRLDQGPHGSTLLLENSTIVGNVANESLGGGLVFSGEGLIRNVTFADNEAAGGEGFFGAAIVAHGEASAGLEVYNTVFSNNVDDHQWTPMTCSIGNPGSPTTLPGANNVQWPATRVGGNNVDDNPCTPDILFADPQLQELADHGGPTPTMMPASESVVIGMGADCPEVDQRGEPRPTMDCAAGAVEP